MWRRAQMVVALGLGATVLAVLPAAVGAAPVAHAQESVRSIPVSFEVVNKNDSKVPCTIPPDGRHYTVRGHITGPSDKLDGDGHQDAVTLYNHGHSFGEFLWNFDKVPGYNTVGELAKKGHVSVTYDRLGYEKSDKPNGNQSCYGSEADVAHQIVDDLRSGHYDTKGRDSIRFHRVAYVGHEQEAFGGEVLAYSFHNIDAFASLDFADGALAPSLYESFGINLKDCGADFIPGSLGKALDGSPNHANARSHNPTGYSYRGETDSDFRNTVFYNVQHDVADKLTDMRNVDPCGFPYSAGQTAVVNNALAHTITIPVLVMFGDHDANLLQPASTFQNQLNFSSSRELTVKKIHNAGAALMFSRTAPEFRNELSRWLNKNGF